MRLLQLFGVLVQISVEFFAGLAIKVVDELSAVFATAVYIILRQIVLLFAMGAHGFDGGGAVLIAHVLVEAGVRPVHRWIFEQRRQITTVNGRAEPSTPIRVMIVVIKSVALTNGANPGRWETFGHLMMSGER